jgi:hypothetical protein
MKEMEEIQTGTKCVGNTEGKGLIDRPGADWRIPLKPLREMCCYMALAMVGIRWRNFMHTAMGILQSPYCT